MRSDPKTFGEAVDANASIEVKYDKLLDDHIQLLKDYTALLNSDVLRIQGEELLDTLEDDEGEEWKGNGDAG